MDWGGVSMGWVEGWVECVGICMVWYGVMSKWDGLGLGWDVGGINGSGRCGQGL